MNRSRPEKKDTKEHGKMIKRILLLKEGRVPAKDARGWRMADAARDRGSAKEPNMIQRAAERHRVDGKGEKGTAGNHGKQAQVKNRSFSGESRHYLPRTQEYESCQQNNVDVDMDEGGVELRSKCGEQFCWVA